MKIKNFFLSLFFLQLCFPAVSQINDGYYKGAQVKNGKPDGAPVTINILSLGNGISIYRENKKPLKGCYYFEVNGRRRTIIGNFTDGVAHGEWTEYMYDDVYRKGAFNKGRYEGEFYTYAYDNSGTNGGLSSVITYKNGVRQHYVAYHSNGKVKEEHFFDDNEKVHGDIITYNEAGIVDKEARYLHGMKHGMQMETNNKGLREYVNYNDGVLEGEFICLYPNGTKQREGAYEKENVKTGKWTLWAEDGKVIQEEHYLNGKLNGEKSVYYATGSLHTKGEYADDKPNGRYIEYDEQNRVSIECNYLNGEFDGIYNAYNDGVLWRECLYKNGEIFSEKEYKNGKINVLRLLDDTGKLVDVQQYDISGKSTYKNKTYKKHTSITLKEDASGIIDIE